ncbi:hypothetical protein [Mesorhizobium sp. B2-3-4]|uniref:hypothetical protein n=1 Tax=Mesorhizobium sp. B2-3-4 TaxID=2589959 RepID=UPI00112A0F58|nr:hypothetical protein [Mesorhizobium sp. B2-3-4]TPM28216.1 hypothetical protein FJ967_28970 [Mesorhizobium sp. B2-3-4]
MSIAPENQVTRSVDKQKLERADRVSRIILDAERQARDAKTARLREQRLSAAPSGKAPKSAAPSGKAPKSAASKRRG